MKRFHLAILLALSACSHDSTRENPLDPSLTPPVALTAAVDDTAGVVRLSWPPAQDEAVQYLVLRNAPQSTAVDTMARLSEQTSFADTVDVGAEWVYRVSVVNAAGLEVPSAPVRPASMELPPVRITDIGIDPTQATARVRWTPYEGPRFTQYEVWRESAGELPVKVATVNDATDSAIVDSALHGGVTHAYRVTVVTSRDERIDSDLVGGSFHDVVTTWPLDLPEGEAAARLYWEEGQLTALLSAPSNISLGTYGPDGSGSVKSVVDIELSEFAPSSVSTSLDRSGERHIAFATRSTFNVASIRVGRFRLDESGGEKTREIFRQSGGLLSDSLTALPSVTISVRDGFAGVGTWTDVSLRTAAQDVPTNWDLWEASASGVTAVEADVLFLRTADFGATSFMFLPWDEVPQSEYTYKETRTTVSGTSLLTIGDPSSFERSFLANIIANPVAGILEITLRVFRVGTSSERVSYAMVPGIPLRLEARFTGAEFAVTAASTVDWVEDTDDGIEWTSIISVGGQLGMTTDRSGRTFDSEGDERPSFDLLSDVAESRVWIDATGETQLGICLPEENHIRFHPVGQTGTRRIDWPRPDDATRAGSGAGQGDGELFFPLSFDVASDGRIYVLDAGNARIQVFDESGGYITQFGSTGSDPGEFDFGSGHSASDFAGSIAVDDDGFIYVADVGNRRIQKFAP